MARARSKSKETRAAVEEPQDESITDFNTTVSGGSWLERLRPLTAPLGSLEVAIVLLSLWAAALLLGTLVESWYDAAAAGELVYATWWFRLLLGLLAANILCAALKKWPWKKHQLGFLITHVGLLTLVAAGAWSALASSRGTMTLADSPAADGLPDGWHTSNIVIDASGHVLRIAPMRASDSEEATVLPFQPGVLGWTTEGISFAPPGDSAANFLQTLATPWKSDWSWTLDDGTRLSVLAYYPHAEAKGTFVEASQGQSFPAVEFELSSPIAGKLPPLWVAEHADFATVDRGPARVAMLPRLKKEELAAFLDPITAINVAGNQRGLLQFATDEQGQLHYRSFHRPAPSPTADVSQQPWQFESAGPISTSDPARKIWSAMGWELKVTRYLAQARRVEDYARVAKPIGVVDPAHPPAVLCRLEHNGKRSEFWIPQTDDGASIHNVAGKSYSLGFHPRWFELDFALTLKSAEQRLDPGTSRPAEQLSHVLLHDPAIGIKDEPHTIELNEPLEYRGYKFYQSMIRTLGRDDGGKLVTQAQLTVGYDPARYLKYAGAAIVSLGIACMFYMRAYALTTIDLWSNSEPGTRNSE